MSVWVAAAGQGGGWVGGKGGRTVPRMATQKRLPGHHLPFWAWESDRERTCRGGLCQRRPVNASAIFELHTGFCLPDILKGQFTQITKKPSIILSFTASTILSYILPIQKDYFFARMSFTDTHSLYSYGWLTFS